MPSLARYIGIGSLGREIRSARLINSPVTRRPLRDALAQS